MSPRPAKTRRGGPRRPRRPAGASDRRLKDLTVLQEIYSILAVEPDLEKTLRHAAEKVAEVLGAGVCAFLLHDEKTNELVVQPGAKGLPKGGDRFLYRVRLDDPLTSSGRVFLTKKPFLSADARRDSRVNPRYAELWNYRSLLVAPLTAGGRCIGVLRAGHRRPGVFAAGHLRLAALVAEHAAAVLENARLYRRVREDVSALRRLSDSKTEFLSMVSHDLLSPISSVQSFLTVLLKEEAGPLTSRQRDFLALCDKSLRRVTVLIDDLLEHSQIEAGVVKVRPESVDVAALLESARRDHASIALEKGVALSAAVPPDLPRVMADPHRLRQVLDNLLRNALKFTPGGGRVLLSARPGEGEVTVSVKDTGIGLSGHEREKIFERYYQVEKDVSRRARGAGLGLAICKSLIEHHGGRIWVDSTPGQGSDFQFSLPLPPVEGRSRIS